MAIDLPWDRQKFFRARRAAYRFFWKDYFIWICLGVIVVLLHDLVALAIAVTGAGAYAFVVWFVQPRSIWKLVNTRAGHGPIIFSDEGITLGDAPDSYREDWSRYSRSRETKNFYVLRRSDHTLSAVFPKRFFGESSDEARFREILRAHTKSTLR